LGFLVGRESEDRVELPEEPVEPVLRLPAPEARRIAARPGRKPVAAARKARKA
jgi:hypothetical protein